MSVGHERAEEEIEHTANNIDVCRAVFSRDTTGRVEEPAKGRKCLTVDMNCEPYSTCSRINLRECEDATHAAPTTIDSLLLGDVLKQCNFCGEKRGHPVDRFGRVGGKLVIPRGLAGRRGPR